MVLNREWLALNIPYSYRIFEFIDEPSPYIPDSWVFVNCEEHVVDSL